MKSSLRAIRTKSAVLLCAPVLFACVVAGVADQKKNSSNAGVFAEDRGKFTIKLDGQTVGHEEFAITHAGSDWIAKGNAEIKSLESPGSKVAGTLTLQPDGTPISYEWSAQTAKKNGAHIVFNNGTAQVTLEMEGARPCTTEEIKDPNRKQPCFFEQSLSFDNPRVAVLDNNLYHQYAVLARLYDWSKRGAQTFPVFIPQELMPGTITAESTGSATVDGRTYEGFRVTTADLEVDLFLDSSHRLMRLEVPSAKVSVVRD